MYMLNFIYVCEYINIHTYIYTNTLNAHKNIDKIKRNESSPFLALPYYECGSAIRHLLWGLCDSAVVIQWSLYFEQEASGAKHGLYK